jgi:hypothetical protein
MKRMRLETAQEGTFVGRSTMHARARFSLSPTQRKES